MFGDVREGQSHTVLTVHQPVKLMFLRRAPLAPGVYQVPGDIRGLVRSVKHRRLMSSGLFSLEFVAGTESVCADTIEVESAPVSTKRDPNDLQPEVVDHVASTTPAPTIIEPEDPVIVVGPANNDGVDDVMSEEEAAQILSDKEADEPADEPVEEGGEPPVQDAEEPVVEEPVVEEPVVEEPVVEEPVVVEDEEPTKKAKRRRRRKPKTD